MKGIKSEEWFRKVFSTTYDPLRNYLFYLSGDIHWADDAIQELFLKLWEKRDSLREETLVPWLYASGRNLFLKWKRHDAVHLRFAKTTGKEEPWEDGSSIAEREEFDVRLQSLISGMPERCRTIFLMSRMDEMTNPEIASRLGVTVKAVEKQMTKALKILRLKLEDVR